MNRILIRHIGFSLVAAVMMLAGSTVFGQNDPQFVIKNDVNNDVNYLAHVKVGETWVLQNATAFNPNTCLWYSGNTVDVTGINHNYYFIDLADTSYHFLSAPLEPNGTLGLSASFPGVQLLRNVEQIYYFYNWDMESPGEGGGVARGIQILGVADSTACVSCGGSWGDDQCWRVYWAEYKSEGDKWELSDSTSYGITENSGRFRKVTVQEHLTPVENTGLINLKMNDIASTNFEISWGEVKSLSSTIITDYQYTAYTSYVFGGSTHNYYNETPGGPSSDHGSSTPTSPNGQATSVTSYEWTLTGDGANYISFNPDEIHSSSNVASPTLYYIRSISTGHKTATLTLTVTYNDNSKQSLSATIKVKSDCQNPGQEDNPIVTYDNVTVTWYNTADRYKIYWTKEEGVWNDANTDIVEGTNSYTFTGLDYNTTYWYKVSAFCGDGFLPNAPVYDFTTNSAPDLMIYGSVFGGGRVANVTGNTTVVVINCDTIGAVYGGNDIAGEVQGAKGSNIILGVDASSESDSYSHLYNNNQASVKVRVNDVYGGGNGYYAYNGTSFQAASSDYDSQQVAPGGEVMSMTQSNQVGDVVWTNESTAPYTLTFPTIVKTAVTVTNDQVKIDSLFGGAKNAFLTYNDWHYNGDSIVIQGGTIFSVFGGNNIGGGQDYGKHYVKVTGTTTNLSESITNTPTTGYGRDFGIRYLFGGGNKVYGSTTGVYIEGGQLDTIFAGGNSADVYAANITVNCSLEAGTGNTFGHTYSNAFVSDTYDGSNIHIKDDYEWDGFSGIYNVRTLFGGNNEASFDSKGNNAVPNITLTSGSVGTVYGGGNAGDMLAHKDGTITLDGDSSINMKHSTKVIMDRPNMLVDYLYGGCQVSNVDYSTWVEIQDGHVGYVYGGCNVSGDVGSTRVNPHAPSSPPNENYQAVQGSTYVKTTGGTVYKNLFAGSNGFYHCNNGVYYVSGINYGDTQGLYIGLPIPTHNETHAIISGGTIKGNVYAGGNLAPVGFTDETNVGNAFPAFVGLASVRMEGGTVENDVYGGGNMAAIQGSNDVRVLGGTIGGALYGGNDRLGQMAQISNRIFPPQYDFASDGHTRLKDLDTRTYVSVSGRPNINIVYGGGNGAYNYDGTAQGGDMDYCNSSDQPIQSYTFVDIHIDGSPDNEHNIPAGHINTVYGGGNGVTVGGSLTVFVNVQNPDISEHINTVFGGNNMGDLALMPNIVLLHGNVGTVYGGCNQGAMIGRHQITVGDVTTYSDLGSMVRLRNEYTAVNSASSIPYTITPTAKVLNAVYGGCRMNGVQYDDQSGNTANTNTLVLVEGGQHPASMFGGSDISGTISGTSQVVVTGGTIGNAFGGGNGNYIYNGNKVYTLNNVLIDTIESGSIARPACNYTQVDMLGGTAANLYGGGNAAGVTNTSTVNMNGGNVTAGIYGGCCSMDTIHGDVAVNVTGGTVGAIGTGTRANVHGGGYGHETHTEGNVTVNIASNGAATGPTINGDIYGGSALGQVSATGSLTQVNFYKGTVNGDVYGGGLGNNDHPAEVSGNVVVNIRGGVFNDADGTAGGGCIYGCNNANGSPLGDVNVNIYATDHGDDYQHNLYPTTPDGGWNVTTLATNALTQTYAIKDVFGGGNLASYNPAAVGENEPPHSTTVHVYNCDNTIEDIFGGGNAADVGIGTSSPSGSNITQYNNTFIYIEGGRIHRVIGGGNGEDPDKPAANIFGTANTTVYAGLIDEVYGGANKKGDVDAINLTISNPSNSSLTNNCGHQVYGKVFGCANAADYNRSVTTNILCGVGEIGELYGGSNLAHIGRSGSNTAHVTLNIYGGTHAQVFAGSKGDLESLSGTGHTDQPSNIYGDVTLNLFGGIITDAYGGSNFNGNIAGTITVNVLDIEDANCTLEHLKLTNVYGASNLAAYTPSSGNTTISPVVNVMHIKDNDGISGNVYGGGNQASVTASPQVNIGYVSDAVISGETTMGTIFNSIKPIGWATTTPTGFPRGYVSGNVFGGGNQAGVTGNPVVNMRDNGTVVTGIYGGCNDDGEIDGNINVNIYGGTMGTSTTARMIDGIFGGGKGHSTETSGDVTVTIGDGTDPTVYADVYGGSAFGEVGATGKTAKVNLKDGTVYGTIFGGGKGQLEDNNTNPVTPAYSATVSGSTEVAIEGGDAKGFAWNTEANAINAAVFGGCNVNGIVLGNATVSYRGGAIGTTNDNANTYGGGLGPDTKVKGNVAITVNGSGVNVYGDVYGGSAKGKVNTENGTSQSGSSKTDVTLTTGTIHGNIYGGGHGPDGNEDADVYGPITVTVEGGTATTVFGCNNNSGTPKNTVTVNVEGGSVTNVCGGGNVASYIPTTNNINYPAVNIKAGIVTNKVVGGGNAANIGSSSISCNPVVTISGGQVCTASTDAGVYGGCNTSGTVNGNITVNVTNADGNTTIGTQDALDYAQQNTLIPVSIHGGGFGDETSTNGNVTVNYGTVAYDAITNEEIHTEYPKLYGDLYGGSALGTVNSASASPANTTTVNVMNGSYVYKKVGNDQYGGNIYGGGRGEDGVSNVNKGKVNGVVHVNIGTGTLDSNGYATSVTGKADVKGCNVFGCNNTNGSPQQDVYVDVYQTNHVDIDVVSYNGNNWNNYAIRNVYGGGNRAQYAPIGNQKVHNTIHTCDNTIENVYGGGNAADTYGTDVSVDGGRFKYIFGGGNGQTVAANIGNGGVHISVYGGHVGWYFSGCNLHGTIGGGNPIEQYGCTANYCPCGDELNVENYYFGANEAVTVGGLSHIINCGDNMKFKNVYGGSRLAVVYGDIKLWVRGGEIENLFAGNEGSDEVQADVKKYPAANYDWGINHDGHPQEVKVYLDEQHALGNDLYGEGGNIQLVLEGGHLGNVYGGNDYRGNVEGDITIIVDSTQANPCQLEIDYLYGGNKKSAYTPDSCYNAVNEQNEVCLTDRVSPNVYLKNGSVNYDVYGGSEGGDPNHDWGNGLVVSNSKVVIGDPSVSAHKARVGRDVFGGGSAANMEGSPNVVVQGKATVNGSVYGGGREGDVDGSTDVKIAPTPSVTPPATPIPPTHRLTVQKVGSGNVSVKYYQNGVLYDVSTGGDVPEGSILQILASPAEGYTFSEWWTDYGNIEHVNHANTRCLMGPRDTILKAVFVDL